MLKYHFKSTPEKQKFLMISLFRDFHMSFKLYQRGLEPSLKEKEQACKTYMFTLFNKVIDRIITDNLEKYISLWIYEWIFVYRYWMLNNHFFIIMHNELCCFKYWSEDIFECSDTNMKIWGGGGVPLPYFLPEPWHPNDHLLQGPNKDRLRSLGLLAMNSLTSISPLAVNGNYKKQNK